MVVITGFQYQTDLVLRRYQHTPKGQGRLFYLDLPYRVSFYMDGEAATLTINPPFATDLASIPKIVPKWIAQKVAAHIEAAVVHDYLYVTAMWSKEIADEIFLAAMKAANVPSWRRAVMYRMVRWFGRGEY